MSNYASSSSETPRSVRLLRLIVGAAIVVLFEYVRVVWIASLPLNLFWPVTGLWAAVGWGASRMSVLPVLVLLALGTMFDLIAGAPIGCWSAIFLSAFLVSSVFRKRAQTDRTGMIRFAGDCISFVAAFLFASWLIGAYLGSLDTREIIGGFLSALILYFLVRPVFRLSSDNRVDS